MDLEWIWFSFCPPARRLVAGEGRDVLSYVLSEQPHREFDQSIDLSLEFGIYNPVHVHVQTPE